MFDAPSFPMLRHPTAALIHSINFVQLIKPDYRQGCRQAKSVMSWLNTLLFFFRRGNHPVPSKAEIGPVATPPALRTFVVVVIQKKGIKQPLGMSPVSESCSELIFVKAFRDLFIVGYGQSTLGRVEHFGLFA